MNKTALKKEEKVLRMKNVAQNNKKKRFLPTANVPRKVAGKLLTGLVSRHVKRYLPLRSSP